MGSPPYLLVIVREVCLVNRVVGGYLMNYKARGSISERV